MKLSWEQVKYTFAMNWYNLINDIRQIPFKVKLKWLVWRKGGGQNVTAEDTKGLPPLIDGGPEAEIALIRIVEVSRMCLYLYEFFGVPEENQSVHSYIAHFIMGKIDDVELAKDLEELIDSDNVRARIYGWMRRADEITDTMVAVARTKPEWNELVKWYKTKVDKKGRPIESDNPAQGA